MSETFDAIIIGAGQAGPPLAGRLTGAGLSVAVIERHLIGGTCVNTGCIPTKTLVASARTAHVVRRAADFGVTTGPIGVDMGAVKARKDAVSGESRSGVESWLDGMVGCTVIRGHARFVGPHEVEVDGRRLAAPRIFINVGGRALIPDMPGVKDVPVLTNTGILGLDSVPEHLVVVGGSYIGLEFAQMYRRFGARVIVVEKGPRLIAREDEDVSAAVREILEDEGIAVRVGAECIRFAPHADGVAVGISCEEGAPEVVGSHVLLAVGRRPNTDDLGLEVAGIEMDARGYIRVDDQLRTSVDGVWAMGDCNGRGAFTHTAYNDFEIVAANLLDGVDRKVTDRIDTYALFIDPPLGRVGMGEAQAREKGHRVRVANGPSRVGRAREKGETAGFMKMVVDADTDAVLGAAILGVGGDEAVHAVLDLMHMGGTAADMRRVMHIHPTVAELIPTVMGELGG
ncbi:LOW QUALITY PROTEIN: PF00070 family, FAD-dependent NAD(P)-disulphide oxidoreductase [Brevundimonas abyssalis TAR-001]|uniref:PF00070 family, FAD-dependent NAD(P)-disulphide oxidoreductase n=2 Tax=Brevundimonas TaxID=41275 RepID=A0A8E0KJE5_9CAUL|nr:LOW QUALITY PROTEIN: PF00070 family, FAD-dependent NAD(P)-disulphide oxidoreductase [Brevundimonas abyssalis TAR-001]